MPESNAVNGVSTELRPTRFLEEKSTHRRAATSSVDASVALIILNSPIDQYGYFRRLYSHASLCICADGAANRLHALLLTQDPKLGWEDALRRALPDVIHGDLDSLDDAVRGRFEQIGVEISKDTDQYSTDFEKAVEKVMERMPNVQDVLVLGSIGGRVDQGIGLLGELYREQKLRHPDVRFWLFFGS